MFGAPVRNRCSALGESLGNKVLEVLDGETDAATDAYRSELVAPDELIDR